MAEATDRPRGAAGATPAPGLGTTAPEPYRPLSLLALVAFAGAVVYALIVAAGAVVALFNRIPWLMPGWSFLLPILVLVLCWVARARIRGSEGTLGGLAFTAWGVRLTVVVGLTYAAYYGFTFFAVSLQAKDCANQFFDQLKQGHTERAFLLGMDVAAKDIDDADLRNTLEFRFNSPTGPGGSGGAFTTFRQSPLVRAIESGGGATRIAPLGVSDWSYQQGGYRVLLKYEVSTPLMAVEMAVETFGRDSKTGGRQWQVMLNRGDTRLIPETMKLTPAGAEWMQKAMLAQNFASTWQDKVNQRLWTDVYLDTLKPSQRERLHKGRQVLRVLPAVSLAGLAPLGLWDQSCLELLDGSRKLAEGKLIRIDDKTFWTSKLERKAILANLQQTFHPRSDGKARFTLQLQKTQMPPSRTAGDELTFLLDAVLTYLDETGSRPKYLVQAQVAVTAEQNEADRSPSAWRIEAIEISSGRTPPEPPQKGRLGG